MRRGPGRPPKDERADLSAEDVAIARTVYLLAMWGFSLRDGAYDAVANVVNAFPQRERVGFIGPDRVEQIYEAWRKQQTRTLQERAKSGRPIPPLQPSRFRRASRVELRRVRGRLEEIARETYRRECADAGQEPDQMREPDLIPPPLPELTSRALRELLAGPLTKGMRAQIQAELKPGPSKPVGRPRKKPKQ
jgi:hypothetical protein